MQKKLAAIEKKIVGLKAELLKIGEMRPGSLTRQYQNRKEKKGGYYQISYTHKMQSRTEYVKPELVEDIQKQIKNFKRFKELTQMWIDLALEHSKLKIEFAKQLKNKLS